MAGTREVFTSSFMRICWFPAWLIGEIKTGLITKSKLNPQEKKPPSGLWSLILSHIHHKSTSHLNVVVVCPVNSGQDIKTLS